MLGHFTHPCSVLHLLQSGSPGPLRPLEGSRVFPPSDLCTLHSLCPNHSSPCSLNGWLLLILQVYSMLPPQKGLPGPLHLQYASPPPLISFTVPSDSFITAQFVRTCQTIFSTFYKMSPTLGCKLHKGRNHVCLYMLPCSPSTCSTARNTQTLEKYVSEWMGGD